MNRGYTREWYLDRIIAIRKIMPDCAISTDIITGFCDESGDDFNETLSLMKKVKFDFLICFLFRKTKNTCRRKYEDNVPKKIKGARLQKVIDLQREHSISNNNFWVGKVMEVLVDGVSKKSVRFRGRNSENHKVVFRENAKITMLMC